MFVSYIKSEKGLPISYDIDEGERRVTSRLWGAVTEDEVYGHNRELRSDPRFNPGYRQFVDLTGITEVRVSTNMISNTAHDQFFTPGTRRAFVEIGRASCRERVSISVGGVAVKQ